MASRWSAGRRRARRAGGPARPGTPTPLLNWVPETRRADGPIARPAQGSLASSLAPPGAPSPHGETEKGKDARRASLIRRPAERWLNENAAEHEDAASSLPDFGGGKAARAPKSIQPELAVDRFQLGRLDQPRMRDHHRMQRAFQLLDPERQEALQLGKFREQVVVLPDEGLQQPLVVRPAVEDLRGRQPITARSAV